MLCDDAFIARMNAKWRGIAAPTDVLSFPLEDDVPSFPGGPPRMLGDLVISLDTAERQALERGCAHAPRGRVLGLAPSRTAKRPQPFAGLEHTRC